jgi:hypothetical protein
VALAFTLPSTTSPSRSVTVLPASAMPLNVGVVTLVMLSAFDRPESYASARSGMPGFSARLSMVSVSTADGSDTLPAASVACEVS